MTTFAAAGKADRPAASRELIEPNVEIRFLRRLLGCHGEINSADAREKPGPDAFRQTVPRLFPAIDTGERELIKIGADLTIGEVK